MSTSGAQNFELQRIASRQYGVITGRQLRQLGLSRGAVAHRVARAGLHRLHRGVFAVGRHDVSERGLWLAAVLAVGEGAVLSHHAAAALHGLERWRPRAVDVTVSRRPSQRPGIRVHMLPLQGRDTTTADGIPVTTLPRTLLDLAGAVPRDRLRRLVHEAMVQRRVNVNMLRQEVTRAKRRRGAGRLAALIRQGPAPTRSELEDRTLALIRRHRLPTPLTNHVIPGLNVEVDFYFPEHKLVIETDGARYHDDPIQRASDAAKQAKLDAAGYRVIRLTWDDVTRRERETAARIRRATAR